jgi:hypothetical protein
MYRLDALDKVEAIVEIVKIELDYYSYHSRLLI